MEKIIKTDPEVKLDRLKKTENNILSELRDLERQIRVKLTELEVTRDLIAEATDEIEEKDIELMDSEHKKLEEELVLLENTIEELSDETATKDEQGNILQRMYALNTEKLQKASATDSIKRLYEIAYAPKLQEKDFKDLYEIKNALGQARQYEFNEILTERIESVYTALQAVRESKPDLDTQIRTYEIETPPIELQPIQLEKTIDADYISNQKNTLEEKK